jgi:hypothetical protein
VSAALLRVRLQARPLQLVVELGRVLIELGDVDPGPQPPPQLAGGQGVVLDPIDDADVQAALGRADQAAAAPFGFVAASQAAMTAARSAPAAREASRPVVGHK